MGRVSTAVGLVGLAAAVPLVPEPGDPLFLATAGAVLVTVAGALWTAHRLDEEGSPDLTGRALAVLVVGGIAAMAAPHGELFGTEMELAFMIAAYGAGLTACGLFAWFVHGVHRRLRPDQRPVFLWAALGSVLFSIPVTDADLLPLLAVSVPAFLLAIELVRSSTQP